VLRHELRRQWEEWLASNNRLQVELDYYRRLFDNAPTGFALLDRSGTILDLNATAAALLGIRARAAIGKPLLVLVARSDTDRLLQYLARCRRRPARAATELLLARTQKPVQLLSHGAWFPDGRRVFYTALIDISMQRQSEAALRESEKRYREIVETAREGICILDHRQHITFVNRRFSAMLRDSPERLLGRSALDLVFETEPDVTRDQSSRQFALARTTEHRVRRADGTEFWAAVSFTSMFNQASHMSGFLLMLSDISDRKELESAREQLALRLVGAQEEERRRVARELHDQLGQHLTGLSLGLSQLELLSANPTATELTRRLRGLADEMSRDAHHLALELRPMILDDLGLAAAVSNYADDLARRTALEMDVHCNLDGRLDSAVETTMYRVIQEALTNIVKHARAKRVSIILERQDSLVRAIVEDDGVGFNAVSLLTYGAPNQRLGLMGMRERAALMGGDLEIESRPGRGTTLFVRVPVRPQNRGDDEEAATVGGRRSRSRS
jgi:PAS domain S-box-containing protein